MIKYSNYKLCKLGDSVALKIEDFKKVQHRLPNSLKEIGIEEDPIFYILIDSNAYQLSFPLSALGESAIYDSKEKTWYIPD